MWWWRVCGGGGVVWWRGRLKHSLSTHFHMKTHSYKRAEFKCEECEFCGETELTMEIHLGKMPQENFECGLCGFEAIDLEKLELHLFTC